jgi:hypothetical protein
VGDSTVLFNVQRHAEGRDEQFDQALNSCKPLWSYECMRMRFLVRAAHILQVNEYQAALGQRVLRKDPDNLAVVYALCKALNPNFPSSVVLARKYAHELIRS